MTPFCARLCGSVVLACLLLIGTALQAQPVHEMPRPADRVPLAAESPILDIVRTPHNWVAVGERGHVLTSEDGEEWTQAQFVPVQATLTRVTHADDRLWAVGHDSTIVHSYDNGQTWALQHFAPELEQPLLDVHFFDRFRGIAIGAFGLFMRTEDGGRNWEVLDMADLVVSEAIDWEEAADAADAMDELEDDDWREEQRMDDGMGAGDEAFDDEWDDDDWDDDDFGFDQGCYQFMECHLNAFVDLGGGRQMIAAERGFGFRTEDGGETWESFMFPYQGSMFGLLAAEGPDTGERIVAFGLRGFIQISDNFGDDWELLDFGQRSTLKGGIQFDDEHMLLVGSGSTQLFLNIADATAEVSEDRLGSDFVAVALGPDGRILLGGADGLSYE